MSYAYNRFYDFSKTSNFTEMNKVFLEIYNRSVKYYLKKPDGYEQKYALSKLNEYVQALEKSLIGLINLGYVTTSNLEFIKDTYKGIDTIGLLNSRYPAGVLGVTDYNRIEVNPKLVNSKTLTSEDKTLLCICHEIGHRFHFEWKKREYIDSLLKNPKILEFHQKLKKLIQELVYSGYELLDEALSEDRAEEITYYFAGKKRPEPTYRQSKLFNGSPFKSNFSYYGELQEPAIMFGKTLRNIGKKESDIMRQLGKAAIDPKFAIKIEKEFRENNRLDDLYALLHSMGTIKEATYEVYGMSEKNTIPNTENALKVINALTNEIASYNKKYIK